MSHDLINIRGMAFTMDIKMIREKKVLTFYSSIGTRQDGPFRGTLPFRIKFQKDFETSIDRNGVWRNSHLRY